MNTTSKGIITILLLCSTTRLQAQAEHLRQPVREHKLYLRAGTGYGFAYAGQTSILNDLSGNFFFNSNTTLKSSTTIATQSVKRGSFGAGMVGSLAGGYKFTRHISFELGINAVIVPAIYKSIAVLDESTGQSTKIHTYTYSTKAQLPIYAVPALVFNTGGRDVSLYSRAGVVLPLKQKIDITYQQEDQYIPSTSSRYEQKFVLTQRFSIGFQGAIGVRRSIGRGISLWGEAAIVSRNAYTKRLELTDNGNGGYVPPNQRITEFDFEIDANAPVYASEPSHALASSVPNSSIGLCIGVAIGL